MIGTLVAIVVNLIILAFWAGRKERDQANMRRDVNGIGNKVRAHEEKQERRHRRYVRFLVKASPTAELKDKATDLLED